MENLYLREKKDVTFAKNERQIEVYNDFINALNSLKEALIANEGKVLNKRIERHLEKINSNNPNVVIRYLSNYSNAFNIYTKNAWFKVNDNGYYIEYKDFDINRLSIINEDNRLDKEKIIQYIDNIITQFDKEIKSIKYTLENYDTMLEEYATILEKYKAFQNAYDYSMINAIGLTRERLY